MATPQGLRWLVKVNNFLEGVPTKVLKYFRSISKAVENMAQSQVDIICRWIAWKINIMIERKRQKIVKTLYEQYGWMLGPVKKQASVIKKAVSNPLEFLGDILGVFFGPVVTIYNWLKTLYKEVPRLARNLSNIASALPPEPPNPQINYNAFKLDIHTISIKEIIMGPEGMKSPEEMFPEPIKPFSKAAFEESFKNAPIKKTKKYGEKSAIGEAIDKQIGSSSILDKKSILD